MKDFNVKDIGCESCSKEPNTRINVARFIEKLDGFLKRNDIENAVKTVDFWEKEARGIQDKGALLSILNEELGLFRRLQNEQRAMDSAASVIELLGERGSEESLSRATICINLATTLKSFGKTDEALPYFKRAEDCYTLNNMRDTYEFATLLNNKASALCDLKSYDEAEECLYRAIEILKALSTHDVEIALSYISLAHLTFDRDSNSYEEVEALLDTAWEYINSPRQPHDSNFAFVISKCAPSLRYFKREVEAIALEEVAEEIYGGIR